MRGFWKGLGNVETRIHVSATFVWLLALMAIVMAEGVSSFRKGVTY